MKTALVIERFCPRLGGGERYAASLACQLLRDGHEVHVFANIWEDSLPVQFHKVPMRGLGLLSFAVNSARELRKDKFDIIQDFGETYYVDVSRLGGGCERFWLSQKRRRMLRVHNLFHLYIERKRYRDGKCKKVVVPSEMVKEQIQKYYGIPEENISVIRNGVNLERFHPQNREKLGGEIRKKYGIGNETLLLFTANNFELKGLGYLLTACSTLKDFTLLIMGRGNIGKFERMAGRLSLQEKVVFAGWVEETEKYFAAADIFIHPTLYDPFANVCLEALASGLPVITTKYNGISEIIADGQEGFIIDDPKNIDLLAGRIQQLFDKERRGEFSKAARARAEEFPLQRNYREVIEIYRAIRK